jgi:uncharacterized protein with HEPN domain
LKTSSKVDRLHLHHIEDACEKILEYTKDGREAFLEQSIIRDAVTNNFAVIGEATKRLSEDTRAKNPQVPWKRIAGFRDVLIHGYDRIDVDETWRVIEEDLVPLRHAIHSILLALGG